MKRFIAFCLYKENKASTQGYYFTWEYKPIDDKITWPNPYEINYPQETIFFFFCKANSKEEMQTKLNSSGNNQPHIMISSDLFVSIVGDFYFIGSPRIEEDKQVYIYNKNTNTSTLMVFPRMKFIKP